MYRAGRIETEWREGSVAYYPEVQEIEVSSVVDPISANINIKVTLLLNLYLYKYKQFNWKFDSRARLNVT